MSGREVSSGPSAKKMETKPEGSKEDIKMELPASWQAQICPRGQLHP